MNREVKLISEVQSLLGSVEVFDYVRDSVFLVAQLVVVAVWVVWVA